MQLALPGAALDCEGATALSRTVERTVDGKESKDTSGREWHLSLGIISREWLLAAGHLGCRPSWLECRGGPTRPVVFDSRASVRTRPEEGS